MALSPTHRFGQIIGEVLQESLRGSLAAVAKKHKLYLDSKCERACRDGKHKVSWVDVKGNTHDLDYVLEKAGTDTVLGKPKAFIEIAYRRYTKHSRNKAQEIQGAIIPLAEAYKDDHPFLGVVVGGVFTEPSLAQLRSHGFGVLYFPFETIVAAFKTVGINAHFDEDSADADVQRKVDAYEKLPQADRDKIARELLKLHKVDIGHFVHELEVSLTRTISAVFVLALHGAHHELKTIKDAMEFIEKYDEPSGAADFVRYEVNVRYSNGDELRGTFASKVEALKFLNGLE